MLLCRVQLEILSIDEFGIAFGELVANVTPEKQHFPGNYHLYLIALLSLEGDFYQC